MMKHHSLALIDLGKLAISNVSVPWWRPQSYFDVPGRSTLARDGGADPMAFTNEAHRAVLAEFLDAIDENRAPVNSGRAGLGVHYLIDALLASAHSRAPVQLKNG